LAGLTVGIIAIPQSLAFARIVGIPIQHGLYSSCLARRSDASPSNDDEVKTPALYVVMFVYVAASTR
jgi:hypothetical protein